MHQYFNVRHACSRRQTSFLCRLQLAVKQQELLGKRPSWFYINRGFTVWFHLGSVLQILTQSKFFTKVLSVSGISIYLGGYASQFFEVLYHSRFFDALYKIMPVALVDQIVDAETGVVDFRSTHSLIAILICNVFDIMGHPLLAYYFWNKSRKDREQNKGSFLAWPVILSAYCFSRCWSVVQLWRVRSLLFWIRCLRL